MQPRLPGCPSSITAWGKIVGPTRPSGPRKRTYRCALTNGCTGEVTNRLPSRPPITSIANVCGSRPLTRRCTVNRVRVNGVSGIPSTTREPRDTTTAMRSALRAACAVVRGARPSRAGRADTTASGSPHPAATATTRVAAAMRRRVFTISASVVRRGGGSHRGAPRTPPLTFAHEAGRSRLRQPRARKIGQEADVRVGVLDASSGLPDEGVPARVPLPLLPRLRRRRGRRRAVGEHRLGAAAGRRCAAHIRRGHAAARLALAVVRRRVRRLRRRPPPGRRDGHQRRRRRMAGRRRPPDLAGRRPVPGRVRRLRSRRPRRPRRHRRFREGRRPAWRPERPHAGGQHDRRRAAFRHLRR